MTEPLVSVRDLKKYYFERDSLFDRLLRNDPVAIKAVDGISFDIERGETVGLVGESGCGKSTAGETLLRLREATDGRVDFEGENIYDLDGDDLLEFRKRAQIVFQDPFSSLDPRMTIGETITEPLRVHDVGTKTERRERAEALLERVGLSADQIDRYPSEFSGGQRQRIGIARALALDPEFIVLDEPTSALDVSVQAQILNLLEDLQEEFDLTYLFISHDLSVVRHICDRVVVMYLGNVVEVGPADALFESPKHPYTTALLESVPRAAVEEHGRRVDALQGDVPSSRDPPSGCRFRTRCPRVIPPTHAELPQAAYREVMTLRDRLERDEFSAESIWELADDPKHEDAAAFEAALRGEYFTREFGGEDAETIQAAIDALVDDDQDRAIEILRERYESVCETTTPVSDEPHHPAMCHLYGVPDGAEEAAGTAESEPAAVAGADDGRSP
ncbi:ABC transporter ATP-binding protein [Haloferacaceae archaeon DSL9]